MPRVKRGAKFIEPDKGNTDIVMVNTKNLNPLAGKTTISPVEKPELAIPAETKTPDVAEASVEKSKSALNRSAKTSKSNSSVRKVSKAKKSWFSFDFKKSTSKPSKRHYPKGKAACYKF